jgi:hypothetical protein
MLLHSDTKFIQGLLFHLLQMFLIFIAEQNIIIFFIYHTVERLLLDKDLLSRGRLQSRFVFLLDDEVMAVFAVV